MKSVQRITKVQLKVNLAEELILIGIASAEPDYKLSLAINKRLKIALRNGEPLKVDDDNCELTFSRFTYHDEAAELTCNLFSNRSGQNSLLKKIKNVDYILQIHHPGISEDYTKRMLSGIRSIPGITAALNLSVNNLKDKNLRYLTL